MTAGRRRSRLQAGTSGVVLVAALMAPRAAAADDGAYGRLDGDLNLSIGAGVAIAAGAPGLAARASVVYAEIAGIHFGYVDALGQPAALVDRSIAAGVTLKPLFWGRFASDLELGRARIDLFLDSLILEIGAFWAAPRGGALVAEPGLELAAGFGFPILADATGPFIEVRGAFRYRRDDLAGSVPFDPITRGAMLSFTLAWHHVVAAHIADAGDRLVR